MRPLELLKTVYLGDRCCKAICVKGCSNEVVIQVDVISRIRSAKGSWDYYSDEDIVDGRLVLSGVRRVCINPPGPIPNDLINELTAVEQAIRGNEKPIYRFTLSVGSVDESGETTEVIVEIDALGLYLQDPQNPATEIRD